MKDKSFYIMTVIFVILTLMNIFYSRSLVNSSLIVLQNTQSEISIMSEKLIELNNDFQAIEMKIKDSEFNVIADYDDSLRELKGSPVTFNRKIEEIRAKLKYLNDKIRIAVKSIDGIKAAGHVVE